MIDPTKKTSADLRKEYLKKWREENRAMRHEWYEKNKRKRQEQMKTWREKNRETMLRYNTEWKEQNAHAKKLHEARSAQKKAIIAAFEKLRFELDKYFELN